uniref:Groucho/TLE N-terminal Q-rich domain-containing protein n=1 Tax=Calidris pygmaea TaxID=425635 RepID=A0A8C3K6K8_9CHAR
MFPQGRHPVSTGAGGRRAGPGQRGGAAAASRAVSPQTPLQPGQPFKFSVLETCDRIKEEFQFLQAQYHSLKLECEKLVSEKTEMQRHYVMYYEMSYGLNIEMHKQAEMVKRLSAICAQIIPFLTQEHQQQVLQAVERAKQVTMGELNSIVGVSQGLGPCGALTGSQGLYCFHKPRAGPLQQEGLSLCPGGSGWLLGSSLAPAALSCHVLGSLCGTEELGVPWVEGAGDAPRTVQPPQPCSPPPPHLPSHPSSRRALHRQGMWAWLRPTPPTSRTICSFSSSSSSFSTFPTMHPPSR